MNIKVKHDFPIFKSHPELVYLDSAATSQKPQQVIDAVSNFYARSNANVHRGIYDLSQQATDIYENTRMSAFTFINARDPKEIVFTSNASAAINYVAYGWAKKFLQADDVIILSEMEHHSNIVPWLRLQEQIGVRLFYLPVTKDYRLDYRAVFNAGIAKEKIKFVSLTHASNVLGTINPLAEVIAFYKENGINAKFLVDAAQSIPHMSVDVQQLDCDFLVFSSHKMLGPSGVGVLWGRQELLEETEPFIVGSHMIATVTKDKAEWQDIPHKFETGTGSLEGIAGLGAAIDYLSTIDMKKIELFEKEITDYALEKLANLSGIKMYGPEESDARLAVFSFAVGNIHAHDIAEILNRNHIAIRSGHHCAQPLMQCLGITGTARASFYLYNEKSDVDRLLEGIEQVKKTFDL